jgi:hypothetical protein
MTAENQNALVPVDDGSTDAVVSLAEALERLLPLCDNNVFEVANWLNLRQQGGEIRLLGDDELMAPNANPSILGVMARIPPDGKTELYIEVRRSIDRCYKRWGFERASFEASRSASLSHLPAQSVDASLFSIGSCTRRSSI